MEGIQCLPIGGVIQVGRSDAATENQRCRFDSGLTSRNGEVAGPSIPFRAAREARLLSLQATPNPSFNPRLATAGTVSPACTTGTIVAVRAYSTRLRSRG